MSDPDSLNADLVPKCVLATPGPASRTIFRQLEDHPPSSTFRPVRGGHHAIVEASPYPHSQVHLDLEERDRDGDTFGFSEIWVVNSVSLSPTAFRLA
jgi:hypothetical protein